MKKIALFALTTMLALSFAACASQPAEQPQAPQETHRVIEFDTAQINIGLPDDWRIDIEGEMRSPLPGTDISYAAFVFSPNVVNESGFALP